MNSICITLIKKKKCPSRYCEYTNDFGIKNSEKREWIFVSDEEKYLKSDVVLIFNRGLFRGLLQPLPSASQCQSATCNDGVCRIHSEAPN